MAAIETAQSEVKEATPGALLFHSKEKHEGSCRAETQCLLPPAAQAMSTCRQLSQFSLFHFLPATETAHALVDSLTQPGCLLSTCPRGCLAVGAGLTVRAEPGHCLGDSLNLTWDMTAWGHHLPVGTGEGLSVPVKHPKCASVGHGSALAALTELPTKVWSPQTYSCRDRRYRERRGGACPVQWLPVLGTGAGSTYGLG